MKKYYHLLLGFGIAIASLSSCSRANYVLGPSTPSYFGSGHTVAARPISAETAAPVAAVPAVAVAAPVVAVVAPVVTAVAPVVAESLPVVAKAPASVSAAAIAVKQVQPSKLQRVLLNKVVKQLAKVQQKQSTASVENTASKTGRAVTITLVGVLLAALGIIITGGFGALLLTIGIITFIVGIVLIVVNLVNG